MSKPAPYHLKACNYEKRLMVFRPTQFKDYSKKHGHGAKNTIGGSAYDITRMSKLEKKQYQLGF